MPRHVKVLEGMLGNVGTEASAMRKQNYSENYIHSGQIKKTRSWKIVSEEKLPSDLLADVNLGLLKHKAWQARSSGLDKAYRAKHIYTNGVEVNIDNRTREEVKHSILRRFKRDR